MNSSSAWILGKSDVLMFFASLAHGMRLVAPKKHFGGDVMFDVVESPTEIVWDYTHDIYPPKRFLLPHHEDIFGYDRSGEIRKAGPSGMPAQAIVGIRSCDVKAIRSQERFFAGQIVDPYYSLRLEKTVFISLACNQPPKDECFCICCDSGPSLESGFDVQLTDLGDAFLYEIGSEKGRKASSPGAHMLKEAPPSALSEQKRLIEQADSLFATSAYMAKAVIHVTADDVPDRVWEEMAAACFRCGACTNLCPVCTCYTIGDRMEADGSYTRHRCWDSCQYSGFTREASGHNPRPTNGSRLARRLYHKASYPYILRDGAHGCVGCGRCVSACPADLGLPNVIKQIRRAVDEQLPAVERPTEV